MWDKTKPATTTKVKEADNYVRNNMAYVKDVVNNQHVDIGQSLAGQESSGECSVCEVDTFVNIDALSDISGGLAFATDYWDFVVNSGSGWVRRGAFPSGTKCIFEAIVAPVGWTAVTSSGFNDRIILLTKGSANGGEIGGTLNSGAWIISGLTHPHTHVYTDVPKHRHSIYTNNGAGGAGYVFHESTNAYGGLLQTGYTGDAAPVTDSPNNSTVTSDGLWRPKGRQFLICEKD